MRDVSSQQQHSCESESEACAGNFKLVNLCLPLSHLIHGLTQTTLLSHNTPYPQAADIHPDIAIISNTPQLSRRCTGPAAVPRRSLTQSPQPESSSPPQALRPSPLQPVSSSLPSSPHPLNHPPACPHQPHPQLPFPTTPSPLQAPPHKPPATPLPLPHPQRQQPTHIKQTAAALCPAVQQQSYLLECIAAVAVAAGGLDPVCRCLERRCHMGVWGGWCCSR